MEEEAKQAEKFRRFLEETMLGVCGGLILLFSLCFILSMSNIR